MFVRRICPLELVETVYCILLKYALGSGKPSSLEQELSFKGPDYFKESMGFETFFLDTKDLKTLGTSST